MFNPFKKKEKLENAEEILKRFDLLKKENEKIKEELEKMKEESFSFINKLEMVRYNPFSSIGGDQSFSIVFLDKKDNGAVITGLYAEGGSRVYAKSVESGKTKHPLSDQEDKLLKKALGNGK